MKPKKGVRVLVIRSKAWKGLWKPLCYFAVQKKGKQSKTAKVFEPAMNVVRSL